MYYEGDRVVVDVSALKEAASKASSRHIAKDWWKLVSHDGRSCGEVLPWDIFIGRLSTKVTNSCLMQFFSAAGVALEGLLWKQSMQKSSAKDGSPLTFKWASLLDDTTSAMVSRKLKQYVDSGFRGTAGNICWGLATDKAWVGSLPLQASLLVVPDGMAVVARPQVIGLDI